MIQVYDAHNTNYETNGDMILCPARCETAVELNSAWGLTIEHPIDNESRWRHIEAGAVLKAPNFDGTEQLYRIRKSKKTEMGVLASADPIFYDAAQDVFLTDTRPTEKNGQQTLDIILRDTRYHGQSDITKISTAYYMDKNALEAIAGDDDNTFIRRWGGEVYYDNFKIIVNRRVGADRGVHIMYGKNLAAISETINMDDVVTRIYPRGYNGISMSSHGYIDSPHIADYPTVRTRTIKYDHIRMAADVSQQDASDLTICHNQAELDAALSAAAQKDFAEGIDAPRVTLKIDMALLAQTTEYQQYQMLEHIGLGDTVYVKHARLGIETSTRVQALTWDACRKRLVDVTLGTVESSYFDRVTAVIKKTEQAIRDNGSIIAEHISGMMDAARAQLRLQNTVAKKQDVRAILFEDLDPASELYGAMALGTQGFQIASERLPDGSDWKWTTFGTAKGFFADLITAGTLQAIQIEGGSVSGTQINGCVISGGKILSQQWSESGDVCLTTKIENGTVEISHIFYVDELGQPYPQGWGSMIHVDKNSGDFKFSEVNGDDKKTKITIGAQGIRVISPSNSSTHTTISPEIIRVIRNGAQVWSV